MRYNNNTSSGHVKHPKKAYQSSWAWYAEERREAEWLRRLAEDDRKRASRHNDNNPPKGAGR